MLTRTRPAWRVALVGAVLPTAIALSGCGTSGSATASARVGAIEVTGAFIPSPPSPSVAAAYFVIHNSGSSADTLLGAITSVATTAVAMREGAGAATGSTVPGLEGMAPIGDLLIPAHGTVTFSPGNDHLMLEGLTAVLAVGQTVIVQLQFAHAGLVTVQIPVVPLDRILTGGGS
jgi:periplasmic copper chaperone A